MRRKDALLFIYGLGIVFLLSSAYNDFKTSNFWNLFMEAEFTGFAIYMIWFYPKRKLKLNDDLMILLLIHFSAFAITSLFNQEWLRFIISLVYITGYIGFRLYRKKHKYSFYLKK
jgi:chromate transport protein ChrA